MELAKLSHEAFAEGKRTVAPLMGFPGVELTNSNIKLAQQNFGEHFKAIRALYEKYSPDMVFPLMDLSVEANALGRYTVFPREDSATVDTRERFSYDELEQMKEIDISFDTRLLGYIEMMKLMKLELPPAVIRCAYVTGPFSLSSLIIGARTAALSILKAPENLHRLCEFATDTIQKYARLLINAGAQIIFILEPTAVMLSPRHFDEFSATYIKRIVKICRYNGADTVYHTCGNTMHLIEKMVQADVGGLSLDSRYAGVILTEVAKRTPTSVAIIGNVSPTVTMTSSNTADVRNAVTELLDEMKCYPNYILSTGCDLPQKTPLKNISAFMETARRYRIKK